MAAIAVGKFEPWCRASAHFNTGNVIETLIFGPRMVAPGAGTHWPYLSYDTATSWLKEMSHQMLFV